MAKIKYLMKRTRAKQYFALLKKRNIKINTAVNSLFIKQDVILESQ